MSHNIKDLDIEFEDANTFCIQLGGAMKSPEDNRDWNWEHISRGLETEKLPAEYSLLGYCREIRDQGHTSTCVAQSVACIREVQEYKENSSMYFSMSPLFIYSQRLNLPGDGMYGRDAMNLLCKSGICLESTFPFNEKDVDKFPSELCFMEANDLKSKNYARITTVVGAKRAIIQNGPLLILLPAFTSNAYFWRPLYKSQQSTGGHAVVLIGWNRRGFILRNSWGKDWADHGYTIFPFKDFKIAYECWSLVDETTIYVPLTMRPAGRNSRFKKLKKFFNCN